MYYEIVYYKFHQEEYVKHVMFPMNDNICSLDQDNEIDVLS